MEENNYLNLLKKHWKKGLYAFLILACIGVWSERLFLRGKVNTKQDYLVANQIFERYKMGNPIALESLEAAERVVKKHPELLPKYETMLSHVNYAQNNFDKAIGYAASSFKRVHQALPSHYATFSEITLEIGEKKFKEAYKHSLALDQQLQGEQLDQLEAFNLLRLVFLCGEPEEKEATFKRLKKLAAFDELEELFHEGEFNLEKYFTAA